MEAEEVKEAAVEELAEVGKGARVELDRTPLQGQLELYPSWEILRYFQILCNEQTLYRQGKDIFLRIPHSQPRSPFAGCIVVSYKLQCAPSRA